MRMFTSVGVLAAVPVCGTHGAMAQTTAPVGHRQPTAASMPHDATLFGVADEGRLAASVSKDHKAKRHRANPRVGFRTSAPTAISSARAFARVSSPSVADDPQARRGEGVPVQFRARSPRPAAYRLGDVHYNAFPNALIARDLIGHYGPESSPREAAT
jgi:hypothetical protein